MAVSEQAPNKRQQVRLPTWMWAALQERARLEMVRPSEIVRRALMRELSRDIFLPSSVTNTNPSSVDSEHRVGVVR